MAEFEEKGGLHSRLISEMGSGTLCLGNSKEKLVLFYFQTPERAIALSYSMLK